MDTEGFPIWEIFDCKASSSYRSHLTEIYEYFYENYFIAIILTLILF